MCVGGGGGGGGHALQFTPFSHPRSKISGSATGRVSVREGGKEVRFLSPLYTGVLISFQSTFHLV